MKNVAIKLAVVVPLVSGLFLTGCTNTQTINNDSPNSQNSSSSENKWKSVEKKAPSISDELADEYAIDGVASAENVAASKKVSASSMLKKLKVSSEAKNSYSRSKFKHWTKAKGTSCNTRVAVLKAESKKKVKMSGCTVKSGKWVSAYDGKTFTNPSKMDIDHMVPLKEAWESGAYKWNSKTRESFANDLGYKNSLIAVSAGSNRSKSDRDPTAWMPKKSKCAYTANWISVKTRWGLSVDSAEKKALTKAVKSCKGLKADSVSKAKITNDKTKKKTSSNPPKSGKNDPRFSTCTAAKKSGYGPYKKGKDPEYAWYIDRDKDGWACE